MKGIFENALSYSCLRNLSVIILLFLAACSTGPTAGTYKVGKPYQVGGKWYEPKVQPDYDEVGVASWYGSDFHNKKTANGGKFDKNVLSAAHKTLPLPSMVKVTNLDNNKTLIVMVNDRGPFSNDRILDVSERAAEILGFKNKGTAKVRVQYLPGQTKRLLSDLPGSKNEKLAEERAFGSSEAIAAIETGGTAAASVPATDASRVFTLTANESEVKAASKDAVKTEELKAPDAKTAEKAPADKTEKVEKTKAPADSADGEVSADSAPKKPAAKAKAPEAAEVPQVQYIQAGTYSVKGNAERVQKALSSVGDVEVVPFKANGKDLYRVKVGPILDKKVAELSLKKVITLGHPDAMLVREASSAAQ